MRKTCVWALNLTILPLFAYQFGLNSQQKTNLHGMYRSITNSTRAGYILYQSIQDYNDSLK